ncbi:hypothetical protein Plec18167_002285 [Paecilomyces lecythidis]|uniref:FAD dependent oxidoreductase domain-containing protein n=1 Tax=Paecilomyces lecythidis TaxID=3004212 RepID=A0ABR3Y8R0_9EURO
MSQLSSFRKIQDDGSSNRIFIIGGGIVGGALAFYLSKEKSGHHVILLDKCLKESLGSTGHAPGFVGQLNESPILTRLAKDTVSEYLSVPGGFDRVGGLELSSTTSGVETLFRRRGLAQSVGLPAEIISPEVAVSLAPDLIDVDSVKTGLYFSSDGTANAQAITSYYIKQAKAGGADFLEATVSGFETKGGVEGDDVEIESILTTEGKIHAEGSTVILATGIWTQYLMKSTNGNDASLTKYPIPIVPVSHPYTFTPTRPPRPGKPYPFVRWLDHHVYARDHGDRDGLGSYDHSPLQIEPTQTAIGSWPTGFNNVLSEACSHVKNGKYFLTDGEHEDQDAATRKRPFNGIFSVTPDNFPLAGKVTGTSNLWLSAAVWVTHAAGTAKFLTRQILGEAGSYDAEDEDIGKALSPSRFEGSDPEKLKRAALSKYNDIYNRNLELRLD